MYLFALGPIAVQSTEMLEAMFYPFDVPKSTSEDCLYLNIWSPTIDSKARLPVLLWIHGGAFTSGMVTVCDQTELCWSCLTVDSLLELFNIIQFIA